MKPQAGEGFLIGFQSVTRNIAPVDAVASKPMFWTVSLFFVGNAAL